VLEHAVVLEVEGDGIGAWVPDLPGCIAVGGSHDEARRLIAEAITLHLDAMLDQGTPTPVPVSRCEYVRAATRSGQTAGRVTGAALQPTVCPRRAQPIA